MKYIVSRNMPRHISESIIDIEDIINSDELHEVYLDSQKGNYPQSNIDGPTLSWLIKQRRKPIKIESSYLFLAAEGRVKGDSIILNANRLGEFNETENFSFIIGSLTARVVINESAYWVHSHADSFNRANHSPFVMLGSICSILLREKEARRLKRYAYGYGTEEQLRASKSVVHDI